MITTKYARKVREINEDFNKINDLIIANKKRIVEVDVELADDAKMIADIKRHYNRILPRLTGDKLIEIEAKLADDNLLLADAIAKYETEQERLTGDIAQCKISINKFNNRVQSSLDWTAEEKATLATDTTSVINEV